MATYDPDDMDALHILPLSIIPLKTAALGRARLIKNTHLIGVVELFSSKESGSGQVEIEALPDTIKFSKETRSDLELIKLLSVLPSYDVYSLRIELRRHNIPVEDHGALKLTPKKAQEIAPHMKAFTRPLIAAVYANTEQRNVDSLHELLALFTAPDTQRARENLSNIARELNIELMDIPRFLETYGDVYLSLAFYQHCLDRSLPALHSLERSIASIRKDPTLATDRQLQQSCSLVQKKLSALSAEIAEILDMFRIRTEDMWERPTEEGFKGMRSLIGDYQAKIGGALCVLNVKMEAWSKMFPKKGTGSLRRRADFIMSELRPGLEAVESIRYADAV